MVAKEKTYFKANLNDATSGSVEVEAGVAGKQIYVQKILVSVSADMNITIEDEAGTDLIGPIYLAENGGFVVEYGDDDPLAVAEGQGLNVLASVASAHTVHAVGYLY